MVDAEGDRRVLTAPGLVQLAPGEHRVQVLAEDRAGNLAVRERNFPAYVHEWLAPLEADGSLVSNVGRTIPVRFVVQKTNGTFAADASVVVELIDAAGTVVSGPLGFGPDPASAVIIQGEVYHANLRTEGLLPGRYVIRARFSSPQLLGQLMVSLSLR